MEGEKDYKLSIRVTKEFYEKFRDLAEKYGVTLNQLGNMSVQAGLGSIIRAISPEEAFTPEQYAAIVKAIKAVEQPDIVPNKGEG